MENGVQRLMNELVEVIPGMEKFKDVTKADADELDKFVIEVLMLDKDHKHLLELQKKQKKKKSRKSNKK